VNKKTLVNLLKYGLAVGVLVYVVCSNWGDPRGTAGKLVRGKADDNGDISGRVVAYTPDISITIEEPSGRQVELALKPGGKTEVVGADGEPLPEGESLAPGDTVTAEAVSRGLAYVWKRYAVERAPVHWGYFTLAFVIGFASMLSTFVRWHILVRAVGLPIRLADSMRLGFIGLFFNTFLPGSVGGDAIKAWFLAKEQNRRAVAVATVIMDRAIALWALVWFVALLGAAFWLGGRLADDVAGAEQCRKIVVIAWAIVGVTSLIWAGLGLLPGKAADRFAARLRQLPRVGGAFAELWLSVWIYRCRPKTVYGIMLLSLAGFVGFVFLFYYSMLTLWDPASGQKVPDLAQHFLIVPIGLVISAMPLFPGGAGIGEYGFGVLYRWLGKSEAAGVLGSLVQRVINWGYGLLGYVIYRRMHLALPPEGPPKLSEAEPEENGSAVVARSPDRATPADRRSPEGAGDLRSGPVARSGDRATTGA
jgi:uncharacterized membrane protein YbhN (UPF0104 family)